MRRALYTVTAALTTTIALACRDAPTAPAPPPLQPAFAILDGAHTGGNPHFFFLPPLASTASHAGAFDATLSPTVVVCALSAAGACAGEPVVTFTTTGVTGSERVRLSHEDELYIVTWHTSAYALVDAALYRITVKVGATTLGFVDVRAGHADKTKGVHGRPDTVAVVNGTVPIKFRIEHHALTPIKPVWKFTMLGAVSKQTADYLGGFDAAVRFMRAQIDTLNSRFNTPNVFAGQFRWSLDSIYEYTGTSWAEIQKPHPGFDYRYTVDGYQGPGGWLGDYRAVALSWPIAEITTPGTTDAIVHEFGHARGAIDLYAIKADGQFNPVNGASYKEGRSIMEYPYGETLWDQHSINLINRSADVVNAPPSYITEAFPSSFTVVVVDSLGVPQVGAQVKMYPVPWFQNRVDANPRYVALTNQQGEYVLPRNPFEPGYAGQPWLMVYPNYLVTVDAGQLPDGRSITGYGWMPITQVQNTWFANPAAPYRLRIVVCWRGILGYRCGSGTQTALTHP